MFCHNCGNKVTEEAGFCSKCGTKLEDNDPTLQITNEPISTLAQELVKSSLLPIASTNTEDFKKFVDNHVQATTKFKRADDLLKNSKPLMFIWICLGAFAVVGFAMAGLMGFLLFTPVFGYAAAYITGRAKYFNLWRKNYPPITVEVNLDELVQFMNANLQYLSPYFSGWERVDDSTVSCKFNKKINIVIFFHSDFENQRRYKISARKESVMFVITDSAAGSTNAGFGEYSCLYKAAPILAAADEYYLKLKVAQ